MKLKLNPWQRIQLEMLVGNVKGAAAEVRKAVKLLDVLEMTDAERAEIGFRTEGGMILWDKQEHAFEIEIKDGNLAAFLTNLVKQKTDWPANRHVIDLFDQMGIED